MSSLNRSTAVVITILLFSVPHFAQAQDSPDYTGEFFTDLTQSIATRDAVQISRRLRIAGQTSRIHPMLVVVTRMNQYPKMPQDIQQFATKLAKDWKIGEVDTHQGILVLFAIEDRKFFVAKTSNLPQSLSDKISSSMRGRVTEALKQGNVSRAMTLAASNIAENLPAANRASSSATPSGSHTVTRTVRERQSQPSSHSRPQSSERGFGWGGLLCPLLILGGIVMSIVSAFSGRSHGYGPGMGGSYGGGGGGAGFGSGLATGGILGYLLGSHTSGSHHGGSSSSNNFIDTTTTESWTDSGGSSGGFDTFGGGDFDGGGSFGEW